MEYIKILLVEDENIEALDIKNSLESMGYKVPYVASNSEEAVDKALEILPDLILMDIILKGEIDGIETVSKIKDLNIPVIYLTAHSEESTIERAKLTEPYAYIIKPYNLPELKHTIDLAIYKNKIEKKLKVSEKQYRNIIETTHEGVTISAPEGGFTYVNRRFEDMIGFKKEELLGHDILEFMEDHQIPSIKNARKRVRNGEDFEIQLQFTKKDGSTLWTMAQSSPIYDDNGKHVSNLVMHTDITEIKKTEQKLGEQAFMLANINDAVIGTDVNFIINYWNESAEKMYGYIQDEIIGQYSDILNPEFLGLTNNEAFKQLEHSGSLNVELIQTRKDGKKIIVESRNQSILDEDGNRYGTIGINRDITERKKADEKLKMANSYNRSLIEASLDPLVTIGADGKINDVNTATEKITGYSRDELKGSVFSDYFIEPEKAEEGYLQVFKEGFVRDYPLEIQHKNGHVTPVLYNATVYKDNSGNVAGVFAAARDITKYKKAEHALRESEKKYKDIFEESFDGLFITSPEGKILDMNKKGISMFGYNNKQEILPLNLREDVYDDPNDREKILKMVNEKGSAEYEVVLKKKNGDRMITHSSLTGVKNNGTIKSYRGIIRDITTSKKIEMDLINAKEEWENTFDAVPDLIAILDTNFRIVRANKALADMMNVTPEETVGLGCHNVFHGLNSAPLYCPFIKLLEDGKEHTIEVQEDNMNSYFIISVSPLHDKSGKLIGAVHVARDITKRKEAENETKKSLEEKEVLLREIHHRVKNNLQIIASLLHLQMANEDKNGIVDVLKESEGRVKTMAMIHEKLYESPNFTDINFKDYIEKLIYDIFYTYKIPKGTIKTTMSIEEINLNIETAIPLGLIINELMTNSIKYAFPQLEGTITITLKYLDGEMELTFSDDGIGLPEDFDLEKTEALGLKIVHSLIDQIDGKIEINNTNGTEFKLKFKELKYKNRL